MRRSGGVGLRERLRRVSLTRLGAFVVVLAMAVPAFYSSVRAQATQAVRSAQDMQASEDVVKLTLHDTIQPVTAGYLRRRAGPCRGDPRTGGTDLAWNAGGLLDSTREMVADIEASPVPVLVFIEPSGSRRALRDFSAGGCGHRGYGTGDQCRRSAPRP